MIPSPTQTSAAIPSTSPSTTPSFRLSRGRYLALLFACAFGSSGCDKCGSASSAVDTSETQLEGAQPPGTPPPGVDGTAGAPAQAADQAAGAPDGAAPGMAAPTAPPEGDHDFNKEEVKAFADVQLTLIQAQQQLSAKAQAGADPNALNQEMMQTAQKAVEESDLSMERYQALAERIGSDPKLEADVRAVIETKIGG